jgi:hypothetical protein
MRLTTSLCVVVLAGLVLTGCGGVRNAAKRAEESNHLKEIAIAYHNYNEEYKKGPSKAEDLAPYVENPKAKQALLSGQFEIIWDVRIVDVLRTGGTSTTVLAYAKDTPTSGGMVAMVDGSVRQMSAEEFKAAPKAQGKP